MTRFAVPGLGAVAILAIPAFGMAEDQPAWKSCISTTNTRAGRYVEIPISALPSGKPPTLRARPVSSSPRMGRP